MTSEEERRGIRRKGGRHGKKRGHKGRKGRTRKERERQDPVTQKSKPTGGIKLCINITPRLEGRTCGVYLIRCASVTQCDVNRTKCLRLCESKQQKERV